MDRSPDLEIYLLKWSGGALIAPGRTLPAARIKLLSPAQVHLAFDGHHPIGASHHQKIVTIDDSLAFCGGLDMTDGRWDTPQHASGNPLRRLKDGEIAQPWHDVTTLMSGPAAAALSAISRIRWLRAEGENLDQDFRPGQDRWPKGVAAQFRDIPVAIARTEPPGRNHPIIAEIERLYLDSIAAARRVIYLESQYFASCSIARAVAARLAEPDGPEIVVINPRAAQGMVEDEAMHVPRSRLIHEMRAADRYDRFRLLYPVNAAGEDIYVHAKVTIVDEDFLRIGSSNIDRRSMGFDTECDVALRADSDEDRKTIRALRDRLLAEHLGRDPAEVAARIDDTGSVIAAIDALNRADGRGLRQIHPRRESLMGKFLANTRIFDPRYRHSATARLGLTSRHVMLGAALAVAGLALWRRNRAPR